MPLPPVTMPEFLMWSIHWVDLKDASDLGTVEKHAPYTGQFLFDLHEQLFLRKKCLNYRCQAIVEWLCTSSPWKLPDGFREAAQPYDYGKLANWVLSTYRLEYDTDAAGRIWDSMIHMVCAGDFKAAQKLYKQCRLQLELYSQHQGGWPQFTIEQLVRSGRIDAVKWVVETFRLKKLFATYSGGYTMRVALLAHDIAMIKFVYKHLMGENPRCITEGKDRPLQFCIQSFEDARDIKALDWVLSRFGLGQYTARAFEFKRSPDRRPSSTLERVKAWWDHHVK